MHSLFNNLATELAVEQRQNAQTNRQIFEMMNKLQEFVLSGATKSCGNLGAISQKLNEMHARCIPQYARSSYDMGIDAVQFRQQRNDLQKQQKISREAAEKMMRQQRLEDLNVYKEFIPEKEVPRTSRAIRATTRMMTSQLRDANLETAGAKKPLPEIETIPTQTRDASPEVGR